MLAMDFAHNRQHRVEHAIRGFTSAAFG